MASTRTKLIVEGVDGSGKSWLVRNLAHVFNLPTEHSPYPCPDQQLLQWQFSNLKSDEVKLFDRIVLSELVYGPILRPEKGYIYTEEQRNNLLSLIRRKAVVIHCRPPKGVVKINVENSPQMDGVPQHWEQLYDKFDEVMAALTMARGHSGVALFVWDFTSGAIEDLHSYVALNMNLERRKK